MNLNTQERIFLDRAALKLQANPSLAPLDAMQAVLADDRRIAQQVFTMPDDAKAELVSALSRSIHRNIRERASTYRHHVVLVTTRGYTRLASYPTRAEALAHVERYPNRTGSAIYRDGTTGTRYSKAECRTLGKEH